MSSCLNLAEFSKVGHFSALALLRLLIDYILRAFQTSLLIALTGADDVPSVFKLFDSFTNGVDLLAIDKRQSRKGVIPLFGER